MSKKAPIISVLCMWMICATNSQAADNKAYLHEGPVLLSNISVIDGLGHDAAPMRDVLIQDGRIARIAVTGMIADPPEGTRQIDGAGLTVLPGLIDAHVHIARVGFKPDEIMKRDIAGMSQALHAHLYAGVTSVLELGGDMELSIRL